VLGRFLQKDPLPGTLGVPMTVVRSYAYVGNKPTNISDPSGQSTLGIVIGMVLIAAV
jgi:RHS repeat-associated protein